MIYSHSDHGTSDLVLRSSIKKCFIYSAYLWIKISYIDNSVTCLMAFKCICSKMNNKAKYAFHQQELIAILLASGSRIHDRFVTIRAVHCTKKLPIFFLLGGSWATKYTYFLRALSSLNSDMRRWKEGGMALNNKFFRLVFCDQSLFKL